MFYYFFGKTKKGEGTRREAKVIGGRRTAHRWSVSDIFLRRHEVVRAGVPCYAPSFNRRSVIKVTSNEKCAFVTPIFCNELLYSLLF